MFSFICKLPFSTSWNSTLKSFKNEVIQDEHSCCCCFISFLTSSFYGRCFFIFCVFFLLESHVLLFNTLLYLEQLLFFFLPYFQCSKDKWDKFVPMLLSFCTRTATIFLGTFKVLKNEITL